MLSRIRRKLALEFGNKSGGNARRKLWDDVKRLVNTEAPIIVDGGSNCGDLIEILLREYNNPRIYAFEANPELARILNTKFVQWGGVQIITKGLSSFNGQSQLNVANNLCSSSMFQRGFFNKKYHGDSTDFYKKITVPVVRLDTEIPAGERVDVIKLDLEGSELEALKGAEGILSRVKVIVTEVEFVEEYEGAPRFSEVDLFLRERGFQLFNFYDMYTQHDGQLTTGDALFVNKDL